MIERLGGRKFIGFVLVAIMLFVLVILNKITGADFISFITGNFGLYALANVVKAKVDEGNTTK